MEGPIFTSGLVLNLVLPVERILCQVKIAEIGALARVFQVDQPLFFVVPEGLTFMLLLGDEEILVTAGLPPVLNGSRCHPDSNFMALFGGFAIVIVKSPAVYTVLCFEFMPLTSDRFALEPVQSGATILSGVVPGF